MTDINFLISKIFDYGDHFVVVCSAKKSNFRTLAEQIVNTLVSEGKQACLLTDQFRGSTEKFKTFDVCLIIQHISIDNFLGLMNLSTFFINGSMSPDQVQHLSHMESYCIDLDQQTVTKVFSESIIEPIDQTLSRITRIKRIFPSIRDLVDSEDTLLHYVGPAGDLIFLSRDFSAEFKHIKSFNAKTIVLLNYDETLQAGLVLRAHRLARMYHNRVDRNVRIFYLTACIGGNESYDNFCLQHGIITEMTILSAAGFETVVKNHVIDSLVPKISEYTNLHKLKKFLFFSRVPRLHRVALMSQLLKFGLVDHGYCSFYMEDFEVDDFKDQFKQNHVEIAEDLQILDQYKHLFPMVLNRTPERDNPVDVTDDDLEYFSTSYFSIVAETVFYQNQPELALPGVFFSEKIFKPLLCKHPFILLGAPGSLECLRKFGYKTFDGIIDESYDLEKDDNARFRLVVQEINRLCNMSDVEWALTADLLAPIVEHNFKVFLEEKLLEVSSDL
jgi:hypothetical protein